MTQKIVVTRCPEEGVVLVLPDGKQVLIKVLDVPYRSRCVIGVEADRDISIHRDTPYRRPQQ